MSGKVCGEITYPFNSYTVEVWEWMNNFITHFTMDVITYPRSHFKPVKWPSCMYMELDGITPVFADGLAPNDSRPSADRMMAKILNQFLLITYNII